MKFRLKENSPDGNSDLFHKEMKNTKIVNNQIKRKEMFKPIAFINMDTNIFKKY